MPRCGGLARCQGCAGDGRRGRSVAIYQIRLPEAVPLPATCLIRRRAATSCARPPVDRNVDGVTESGQAVTSPTLELRVRKCSPTSSSRHRSCSRPPVQCCWPCDNWRPGACGPRRRLHPDEERRCMLNPRVEVLRNGIIVSCEAGPESPLHGPNFMAAIAILAERRAPCGSVVATAFSDRLLDHSHILVMRGEGPLHREAAASRGVRRLSPYAWGRPVVIRGGSLFRLSVRVVAPQGRHEA